MKYLGIDYGTKKTGLAISDDTGSLAFPLGILPTDTQLIHHITTYIQERDIDVLVIGQSLDGNGKENSLMNAITAFLEKLKKNISVPIVFQNEFASTLAVRQDIQKLTQAPRNQASPRRSEYMALDDRSATLILQRYLDAHSTRPTSSREQLSDLQEEAYES